MSDTTETTVAFVEPHSLGIGVMQDGALCEWVVEPADADLAPDADDLTEDGAPAAFHVDSGAPGRPIDTNKASQALLDAGYRTVGDYVHDGLDGLMVEVEPA